MAILRAILLTLNHSAIPNETPAVPPIQEHPPAEVVTASVLMYASLLISLLAAFIAMLGKQWLNRYLRHAGGSTIERCGDRQRKCDGLEKWPFHLFVESLPVMLQVALLFLACGLCRHMASINASVAGVLITLTGLGFLFYLGIVVAGASSYACPFQTPGSNALRGLWKKIQPHTALLAHRIVTTGADMFPALSSSIRHPLWKATSLLGLTIRCFKQAIVKMALSFNKWIRVAFRSRQDDHRPSLVVSLGEVQEDSRVSPEFESPPHNSDPSPNGDVYSIHSNNFSYPDPKSPSEEIDFSFQHRAPAPTPGNAHPWLVQEGLAAIQNTNAKDVRCVSWILRNITDPEALDAAIRFAGTVRWFEDGLDVEPPYQIIVSAFDTCFDSTGTVYPGLSDRAYHSARAILWIHIRAMCKTQEFARNFPLPYNIRNVYFNSDLDSLQVVASITGAPEVSARTDIFYKCSTPEHMQFALRAFHTSAGPDRESRTPFLSVAGLGISPGTLFLWM